MAQLIYESTDLGQAAQIERDLSPGTYEARLSILSPISQEDLDAFHQSLLDSGVDVVGFIQERAKGLWQIAVKYKIHEPAESIAFAQLLIPLIPTAIVGILVGIALFKIRDIITLVLVTGAVIGFIAFVLKQPLTEAVKKF